MLHYRGEILGRYETKNGREMVLIGVEETIPHILRRNIKTGLYDWASCVFTVMLLYGLALVDRMLAITDVPAGNFERLVYILASFCVLFRLWQLRGRNTDMPRVHLIGFAVGEVIGFILFKLHLDSLLTFAVASLILYSVRVVETVMVLCLISVVYEKCRKYARLKEQRVGEVDILQKETKDV